MRNLLLDLRFGLRVLAARPGFAAVAALTLGLGIACTATSFSWIDSVLLRPFPGAARSQELVVLEMVTPTAPNGGTSISWQDYLDYRDRIHSLSGLALGRQTSFSLGDGQPARLTWGELVSANYFDVMGVRPFLGRLFSGGPGGDTLGANPVVVISFGLWKSYFHSDPAIAGKTVRINRVPLTIAGVAPLPFRGSSPVIQYDLWVPATMGPTLGILDANVFRDRDNRGQFEAIGRLAPGSTVGPASAEANALAHSLAVATPKTNRGVGAAILPSWQAHNGVNEYLRAPLAILMAVSCVLLLIVCANVANLLLARSVGRQREFGIRFALGAGRSRVAAQVLTETLVLAIAGSGVGALVLLWMQGSLVAMVPSIGIPINTTMAWSARVIAFTAAAGIAATLISGTAPALFVFRSNLNEVLKEGSRSDTAGAASRRTRSLLVIGEVALATVALIGAGLFVRSFRNLRAVNPGFDSDHVLLGRFFIGSAGYDAARAENFAIRIKERLTEAGGVESVAYTDFVPLSNTAGPYNTVRLDGYTPATGESMSVNRALISPGYFDVMRIPLLEGREFRASDTREAEPVMIVNQAFARRYFQGRSPLGRKVRAAGKWCTVVGMARDSRYFHPGEAPSAHFYLAFAQFYSGSSELYLLLRGSQDPSAAVLRRAVTDTDTAAAAFHAVALSEYIQVATFGQKVAANLMGALGLMCLLLAASGLYSVISYTVSQRVAEIGIRIAMGARPGNVIAMVVRQGMQMTGWGLVLGMALAFAITHTISGMLFGVTALDPVTFAASGAFLAVVSLGAAWLPAWRATRIDPMQALRR